jgi:large subunit ribosomal protein L35
MPKQKTHKGLKKRIKVTATGKLVRKRAFAGHLMSGKSGNRCRRLRHSTLVDKTMAKRVRIKLIAY